MFEALETADINQEDLSVYPEGSPCAMGDCPISASEPEVTIEETIALHKKDLVVFIRNNTIRLATVVSKGNKYLGLNVLGMKSNTKIPADTELIPVTVFVSKEILELAGESVGIDI